MKVPQNNKFDKGRASVDALLFPNYHDHMQFAALSLDDRGSPYYGACSLVLKDAAILHRASVFEKNSFFFCQEHHVPAGGPLPLGYRAEWSHRHELAVAKLTERIDTSTAPTDFPKILLESAPSENADFIEVHIYGPIHILAVAKVIFHKTKSSREDKLVIKSIQKQLKGKSIPFEEDR